MKKIMVAMSLAVLLTVVAVQLVSAQDVFDPITSSNAAVAFVTGQVSGVEAVILDPVLGSIAYTNLPCSGFEDGIGVILQAKWPGVASTNTCRIFVWFSNIHHIDMIFADAAGVDPSRLGSRGYIPDYKFQLVQVPMEGLPGGILAARAYSLDPVSGIRTPIGELYVDNGIVSVPFVIRFEDQSQVTIIGARDVYVEASWLDGRKSYPCFSDNRERGCRGFFRGKGQKLFFPQGYLRSLQNGG